MTFFLQPIPKLLPIRSKICGKSLRLAHGSLVIQQKYQYSDRELIEQLAENPYYQYFIGLPGYQEEPPIDASTLVLFRKRLDMKVIMEAKPMNICSPALKKRMIKSIGMMRTIRHPVQAADLMPRRILRKIRGH